MGSNDNNNAPQIPTFFAVTDLPDWLRAPVPTVTSAPRRESARARQAWATPDTTATPEETGDFQSAGATAITRLVPATRVRPRRKWRGLFGIGAMLPAMACVA